MVAEWRGTDRVQGGVGNEGSTATSHPHLNPTPVYCMTKQQQGSLCRSF